MKRDWKGYIKKNRTEGDCQLVAAVNAYHFLTGKRITDRRYERLIDLCGCRYGSAISIEKVHADLGVEVLSHYHTPGNCPKLPLEMNVRHKAYGNHSILAVEYEAITDSCRILNFSRATNLRGWMYAEDLNHYIITNPDNTHWRCRSFGIKGKK